MGSKTVITMMLWYYALIIVERIFNINKIYKSAIASSMFDGWFNRLSRAKMYLISLY